ncbi:MAG: hypothetical protein XD40_2334 [Archaeoglobus fulgidus]|uniref:HTH arsR-type domain-containing protein n=2 Tax=Archaeoglobus fulgidus TaxID=2234 RepID=A0A101DBH4_ARCFL|nr:winged helix-turn-helix domain-containing protein [Archaeoglobus fulgidus]KUJ92469.1 MAG: hypothetical protein XD40_2334 [Archaeoglobus fulgidus]
MMEELLRRLEEMGRKIDVLQDSMMSLATAVEMLAEREGEREFLAELKAAVKSEKSRIENLSPESCKLRDFCLSRVNKATSKVIRVYSEKGAEEALEEVKKHKEAVEKHLDSSLCPDKNCMQSIVDTFETLESLIKHSLEISEQRRTILRRWNSIEEIDEEAVAKLLSPLSNPIRIRILKALTKGGKSYAELERAVGIKGGHLQFHLRNLMEAGYITQETLRRRYIITHSGLKVLNCLVELRDAMGIVMASRR